MFYNKYIALCERHNEQPYKLVRELGAKSNSSVDQWKKGSVPRKKMLNAIADHFGVSVSYLLDLTDEEQDFVTKKIPDHEVEDEDIEKRFDELMRKMNGDKEKLEKLLFYGDLVADGKL